MATPKVQGKEIQAEMIVQGGDDLSQEGFLEKLEHFRDGLDKINQRFQNRLSHKVSFAEDYLKGRLGFVVYFKRRIGGNKCLSEEFLNQVNHL